MGYNWASNKLAILFSIVIPSSQYGQIGTDIHCELKSPVACIHMHLFQTTASDTMKSEGSLCRCCSIKSYWLSLSLYTPRCEFHCPKSCIHCKVKSTNFTDSLLLCKIFIFHFQNYDNFPTCKVVGKSLFTVKINI